jgi:hypothetical protein
MWASFEFFEFSQQKISKTKFDKKGKVIEKGLRIVALVRRI